MYSIGPPRGRRGETGKFLGVCTAVAGALLLLGLLALGWSHWQEFLSAACVTFAGLLLTISAVEVALDYQRRLRLRPVRDELLRRLLALAVGVLGDIAVVTGQPALITGQPGDELIGAARALLEHLQMVFMTRIPRAGRYVPQLELDRYVAWGGDVAALVAQVDPLISAQVVPLLAAIGEDAELVRRSLRLATAIRAPSRLPAPSASEALTYLMRLAQAAGNVLGRLHILYGQDAAWRSVFEEGDVVSYPPPPPGRKPRYWSVTGPPDP
jgi:hypothetical protein